MARLGQKNAQRGKGTASSSSAASRARESANLTLEQAARKARICPAYLRRLEKKGGAGYALALRLSRLYNCSMWYFL